MVFLPRNPTQVAQMMRNKAAMRARVVAIINEDAAIQDKDPAIHEKEAGIGTVCTQYFGLFNNQDLNRVSYRVLF